MGYYVEISGVDSITGQPIRVQWKPMSDKMRRKASAGSSLCVSQEERSNGS